ncbi:MAG TPA: serine/threonine-protein kinase [Thermoanaerobaculia bacterium]|nr:serine/threonine-protein kinase [Thermoanaerobaculia bacterium]
MSQITCLRCKQLIDAQLDQCPSCGDRVTNFQRTYASRLIDGKYQILDRLGVGGMGEIFKVRHIHLNELRVIKIMRPNVAADDQGLQRFLQEARTSTMIKHRNLAMLYDFAQLEDGSYYMVWEFIDGVNIQKWIAQNGPVPPRLSVEIAIQALTGLEHLHSMGLIHRDISPENIMLSQDHHGKLLVKVIDFGIAKSLAEGEGGQGLTQTGMFLGKLKYASPEQAGYLKEGEHLDPRSDLYSFGIVMYEMLAGRAPFQATNPHGYILKHVTEKPAPIAETNPQAKVPAQLESVIMKSLEKSRDNRFATAGDFANALESIRGAIPPDQKYGLGERMVTLSAAKTLSELPKYTGTSATMGSQPTQHTVAGGPQPTQRTAITASQNEPTQLERGVTASQRPTLGSNEATVVDRFGATASGAAPTAVESKLSGAEPTVLEHVGPAKKKNAGVIAAIAAAAIIVIGAGVYFLTRPGKEIQVTGTATATATSGTQVTSTAPVVPGDHGILLLSASPWGDIEKIVNMTSHKPVELSDENRSTPAAIELDPGHYSITVRGPNDVQTVDVNIEAGKRTKKSITTANVNFDEIEKEVKP